MQPQSKRARSDEQKLERRAVILKAAATHFSDVGFEKFSMANLAKLCGLSKGTLYLYFETREELLLTLCLEELDHWQAAFVATAPEWISDEAFATHYFRTMNAEQVLLQLFMRLDSVIEHNISVDAYVDAKRHMNRVIFEVSQLMVTRLDLTESQCLDTSSSLAALMMGSVQGDRGPEFDESELPEDVQQFRSLFSSEQLFITNACRIIRGIRMETP